MGNYLREIDTMTKQKTLGLRQRIAQAATEEELIALLQSRGSYSDASPKTRQRWWNTAQRRRKELAK